MENNWFKVEQLIFADPKKHSSLGVRNKDKDGAQKLVWSRVYTSAEMKKIDGLIQSMIHLAPSGSIYARRVGLLQKYMINVMKRERSDVMGKEEKRQEK